MTSDSADWLLQVPYNVREMVRCVILTKCMRHFLQSILNAKPAIRMLVSEQHFSLSPDVTNRDVL